MKIKDITNHMNDYGTRPRIHVYKTENDYSIHSTLHANRSMVADNPDWYYTVMTTECLTFCLVPKFFHNKGYWVTMVQHNHGDWNKEATYELNLVEA
jgi:hypothetical protein